MKNFLKFIIAIVLCELIGFINVPLTVSSITIWYQTLNRPVFSPPNWLFGPVWTLLYALMGISAYLIWRKGFENKKVKRALFFFLIQIFYNFLWSLIFFGMHSPLVAYLDIVVLWGYIIITIIEFQHISKFAAYLLIPYLYWVSFATVLNFSIVLLNR